MKPFDSETSSAGSADIFDDGSDKDDQIVSEKEEDDDDKIDTESDDNEEDEDDEDDGDSNNDTLESSPFWEKSINHVFGIMQDKFDETVIDLAQRNTTGNVKLYEKKAYKMLRPKYNRQLRNFYQRTIRMMDIIRRDPVHKKIMDTARKLREDEEYERDESLKYAVKKRCYLLDQKLDDYLPPVISSDS